MTPATNVNGRLVKPILNVKEARVLLLLVREAQTREVVRATDQAVLARAAAALEASVTAALRRYDT